MTNRSGHLWALIEDWLIAFRYRPPSQRELATKLGVSKSALTDYKYVRTVSMPSARFLVALAREIQVPYERVLDAALKDWAYRGDRLSEIEAGPESRLANLMRGGPPLVEGHPEDEDSGGRSKPA